MFEVAEIPRKISKEQYKQEVPTLRERLLFSQLALKDDPKRAVVIVVSGLDGAGKGETINLLNDWLDPRYMRTRAMRTPSDEELARPRLYRFWRALPPKGRTAVFFGSWYSKPMADRIAGRITDAEYDQALQRIRRFEKMLTDEGVVLLKLWFHLSKKQQKARLEELEKDKKTRWRVSKKDWQGYESRDRFLAIAERTVRETSRESTSWELVAGYEPHFRNLTVGHHVLHAFEHALQAQVKPEIHVDDSTPVDGRIVLSHVDLSQALGKKEYRKKLPKAQARLNKLSRHREFTKRSVVAVFEGWDAAGKGGAIRRITRALDARQYQVVPIAAPTEEERAQPYLWRFWRNLPAKGHFTIFDRSWYGRVLVERVEGFSPAWDWVRAYSEINDFEETLVRNGIVVAKFWLHIDAEEQLRRFEERKRIAFKRHKITEEDWRNREKWRDYELAVHDMIEKTSTEIAPWTVVPANDKRYARVTVVNALAEHMEAAFAK
jgi:polyphosphate:AMP phosphotransferase